MAEVIERKTSEEIKTKILEVLNDKPLNALEISKAIGSNWSTVKNYITDLIAEKKVKEISFGNQIIYQKVVGDTYFGIPIKEEDRKMLKFIISTAIKEYKEIKEEQIKKTELAKLIYSINLNLKLNLPIVWYLYGPMPLMILDLQNDYSTEFVPSNEQEIKNAIKRWIKEKTRKYVREMIKELYLQENAELYDLKVKVYDDLKSKKSENLKDWSREFYLTSMASGLDSEFSYRLYNLVSGLDFLKKLKDHSGEVLLAFDGVWKYLASKNLYNSLKGLKYSEEEAEIYLRTVIETKKYLAEEALSNLNEIYLGELPSEPIKLKEDELDKKIGKVVDSWIKSEVWRE